MFNLKCHQFSFTLNGKEEWRLNSILYLAVLVQTFQTAALRDRHRQPNARLPHHRPQPAAQHRCPGRRGRGGLWKHQDRGDGAGQGVHSHLEPAPLHQLPDRDPCLQPPKRGVPLQHGSVRQRPHNARRWEHLLSNFISFCFMCFHLCSKSSCFLGGLFFSSNLQEETWKSCSVHFLFFT